MVFEDTFSGSSIDTTKWFRNWLGGDDVSRTPPPASSENSSVDPTHLSVVGGNLELALTAEVNTVNSVSRDYVGALCHTAGKFEFHYGHMEARLNLVGQTDGQNKPLANWPAWWCNSTTDPGLEIDLLEAFGTGDTASNNIHYWNSGVDTQEGNGTVSTGLSGWHVVGAEWRSGQVDFYYDGSKVRTVTNAGITSYPNFVILEHGAQSVASDSKNRAGTSMLVDYVRVWQRA